MDPYVHKLFRYRELLRGDLPLAARISIEWLLVTAVREHTHLKPMPSPWEGLEMPGLVTVANDVVGQAVALMNAQFGSFQLYVPEEDILLLVAHKNFAVDFIDGFACFTPDGRSACSRALASGQRVVIDDVSDDELFAPHIGAARSAGFSSVQATPLRGEAGQVIGIISTHFAAPHTCANDRLARLDEYVPDASSQILAACA